MSQTLPSASARSRRSSSSSTSSSSSAFTQVTTLLTHDPTWTGLGHALLILTALWWAWASFAWLTSTFDAEEGIVLAALLAALAAMFVAALAVPEAFGDDGVVFGVAFLFVAPCSRRCTRSARAATGSFLRRSCGSLPGCSGARAHPRRGIRRRHAADAALDRRARRRLRRRLLRRPARLEGAAGALRRAPRPDRDHRDRRVADRDRARRARAPRSDGGVIVAALLGLRRRDVVLARVLRLLPDPRGRLLDRAQGEQRSRSPATSTPTSTCRWSPASSSSRSR